MDFAQIQRISGMLREARDYIKTMEPYADRRQHLRRWRNLDSELQHRIIHKLPLRVLEEVVKDFARICRDELAIVQWDKDDHPEGP